MHEYTCEIILILPNISITLVWCVNHRFSWQIVRSFLYGAWCCPGEFHHQGITRHDTDISCHGACSTRWLKIMNISLTKTVKKIIISIFYLWSQKSTDHHNITNNRNVMMIWFFFFFNLKWLDHFFCRKRDIISHVVFSFLYESWIVR